MIQNEFQNEEFWNKFNLQFQIAVMLYDDCGVIVRWPTLGHVLDGHTQPHIMRLIWVKLNRSDKPRRPNLANWLTKALICIAIKRTKWQSNDSFVIWVNDEFWASNFEFRVSSMTSLKRFPLRVFQTRKSSWRKSLSFFPKRNKRQETRIWTSNCKIPHKNFLWRKGLHRNSCWRWWLSEKFNDHKIVLIFQSH